MASFVFNGLELFFSYWVGTQRVSRAGLPIEQVLGVSKFLAVSQ